MLSRGSGGAGRKHVLMLKPYVIRAPDGPTPLTETASALRLRVTLGWVRNWPAFGGGMTIESLPAGGCRGICAPRGSQLGRSRGLPGYVLAPFPLEFAGHDRAAEVTIGLRAAVFVSSYPARFARAPVRNLGKTHPLVR